MGRHTRTVSAYVEYQPHGTEQFNSILNMFCCKKYQLAIVESSVVTEEAIEAWFVFSKAG
jgi:hypothetical protein